ncbi:hypothetical protein NDU88_009422 [Pleurodeles waltl]|uniref:Coiled-coil domain-containing protein 110 n=1 Tax=Pleurodeles waltl TaxID=8319 RepID=A0AAV7QV46_PLEWA|nr:hypothetical protein NDU88_009422 [Pleurodeles waltl]
MSQEKALLLNSHEKRLETQTHSRRPNADFSLHAQVEMLVDRRDLTWNDASRSYNTEEVDMQHQCGNASVLAGIETQSLSTLMPNDTGSPERSAQGEYCEKYISPAFDSHQEYEKAHSREIRHGCQVSTPIYSPRAREDEVEANKPFCLSKTAKQLWVPTNGNERDNCTWGLDYIDGIPQAEERIVVEKQHLCDNIFGQRHFGTNESIAALPAESDKPKKAETCLQVKNLKENAGKVGGVVSLGASLAIESNEVKKEKRQPMQTTSAFESNTYNKNERQERNIYDIFMSRYQLKVKCNELQQFEMGLIRTSDNYQHGQKEGGKVTQNETENKGFLQSLMDEMALKQDEIQYLKMKNVCLTDKFLQQKKNSTLCVNELKRLTCKYITLKKHAKKLESERYHNIQTRTKAQQMMRKADIEKVEVSHTCNVLKEENAVFVKSSESMKEEIYYIKQNQFRLVEEKQMLEECVSGLQTENEQLAKCIEQAAKEIKSTKTLLSIKDLEITILVKKLRDAIDDLKNLEINISEYEFETRSMAFQIEQINQEKCQLEKNMENNYLESIARDDALGERVRSFQNECSALSKMVSDLKEDKNVLKDELREQVKEKRYFAAERNQYCRETEKLEKSVKILERERDILKEELAVMHINYLSLSDRITNRMNVIEEEEEIKLQNS